MQATIRDGVKFRMMIENVVNLINGIVNLILDTEQGWIIEQCDDGYSSMIGLTLKKSFFEKYSCERNYTIGVFLPSFVKVLRLLQKDEPITFITDDTLETMEIYLGDTTQPRLRFVMNLSELTQERLNVPDIDYQYTIQISVDTLVEYLKGIFATKGEILTIVLHKQGLQFDSNGEITGNALIPMTYLKFDVNPKMQLAEGWFFKQPFSLSKMEKIMDKHRGGQCTLMLHETEPLHLFFEYANSNSNTADGRLEYYLAPRITDE